MPASPAMRAISDDGASTNTPTANRLRPGAAARAAAMHVRAVAGLDLPSRGRENESDQIRPGGSGNCRVLRIAQTADLDDASASEEPIQVFPSRN